MQSFFLVGRHERQPLDIRIGVDDASGQLIVSVWRGNLLEYEVAASKETSGTIAERLLSSAASTKRIKIASA